MLLPHKWLEWGGRSHSPVGKCRPPETLSSIPKETFKHSKQLSGSGQGADTAMVPFASQQIPVLIPGCSNPLLGHWKGLTLPAPVVQEEGCP